MLHPASAEDRRFLLALALALLVHIALGVILSQLSDKPVAPSDEPRVLRVTLTPGSGESLSGGGSRTAGAQAPRSVPAEPEAAAPAAGPAAPPEEAAPAKPASGEDEPARESPTSPEAETALDKPEPPETPGSVATPSDAPSNGEIGSQEALLPAPSPAPEGGTSVTDLEPRRAGIGGASHPAASTGGTEGSSEGGGVPGAGNIPTLEPRRYVAPEYPLVARHAGWSGTVVVSLTIGASGRVNDVDLLKSSGHEPLDEAAVQAARVWRFATREAGRRSLHRFEFRLE